MGSPEELEIDHSIADVDKPLINILHNVNNNAETLSYSFARETIETFTPIYNEMRESIRAIDLQGTKIKPRRRLDGTISYRGAKKMLWVVCGETLPDDWMMPYFVEELIHYHKVSWLPVRDRRKTMVRELGVTLAKLRLQHRIFERME